MVRIVEDELRAAGRSDDAAFDLMRKIQRWSGARLYIVHERASITYVLTFTSVKPGPNVSEVD